MSYTPRTSNSGMSATTPYNNHYYVGSATTGYFYNYSNANNYQCTAYCMGRLGEIAGEPVTTFSAYPSSPTHRIFPNRTGYGDAKEWYNDTSWSKTTDKTKPKLGAIVCYSKYPNDGGGGHVQIVEKIDGNTIYVSQNQTCYGSSFLTAINVNNLPSSGSTIFMGYIYNPYVDESPTPGPTPTGQYTVTLIPSPSNAGYCVGGGSYDVGTRAYLYAYPYDGYEFEKWSDGYTYADRYWDIYSDLTLTAYFKKKTYSVALNVEPSDGGTVTGAGTYESGTSVTIKATPNKHYKFVSWSDGDTNAERTITVDSDISLTAYFEKCGILIKGSMGIDFQIL